MYMRVIWRMMMNVSKVDYFDIKKGDLVEIKEFVKSENGMCDYYKVVLPYTTKIHYLFTVELEL